MSPILRLSAGLAGLLLAGLLPACAGRVPSAERHFGAAVRGAIAAQSLHPEAAANPDPVAGLDARAARAALARYEKSFAEPAAQPVTFMFGGSGGK